MRRPRVRILVGLFPAYVGEYLEGTTGTIVAIREEDLLCVAVQISKGDVDRITQENVESVREPMLMFGPKVVERRGVVQELRYAVLS